MSLPIRHLPVLQNWDCHVCGNCCKEYNVTVTDEERRRIEAQGWTKEPDFDLPLFTKHGPWWKRTYRLNHRSDGSCIFLSEAGRCRIHERFGFETKPLACRLFPFVLIPAGNHWRVGLRYACPSAARNLGRGLSQHDEELRKFARLLAEREKLKIGPEGFELPPPALQPGHRVSWPDLLAIVQVLLDILRDRRSRMERRLRRCLALGRMLRQAKLDKIEGARLNELLNLLRHGIDAEVPKDPASVPPPSWAGRVLFRQALALFSRKDQGPNRGAATGSRLALLRAALQFARGRGPVPRLHGWLPEATFEQMETGTGPLPEDAEALLERYYSMKVGSVQFCGPACFGMRFWDGFEVLALTYPMIVWWSRAFADLPRADAIAKALSIVDDHFGFNRMLATGRQRLSFRILGRWGELEKLIAWYGQ
jgi:lysine-N-methylase